MKVRLKEYHHNRQRSNVTLYFDASIYIDNKLASCRFSPQT
jgi:hypothetical protein